MDREEALRVLNLQGSATEEEIERKFTQLASKLRSKVTQGDNTPYWEKELERVTKAHATLVSGLVSDQEDPGEAGRKLLREYAIVHTPRFEADDEENQKEAVLLAQSTLWNAMRFLLVGQGAVSVELRYTCTRRDRSIDASLRLLSDGKLAEQDLTMVLERLLPLEYEWVATNPGQDRTSPRETAPWYVVQVTRRIDFFELPAFLPWMVRLPPSNAPAPGVNDPDQQARPVPQASTSADRQLRVLPNLRIPILEECEVKRVCVPVLGELRDEAPGRRRLCQEMQHAAPLILSITLHPISNRSLSHDRLIANGLRRALEPFGHLVPEVGFTSDARRIRGVYDRYWLPEKQLCHLTIRIAARDSWKASAVAHCLCANLGGLRGFDIREPVASDGGLDSVLSAPVPIDDLSEPRGQEALRSLLRDAEIDYQYLYAGFLHRLPHYYTLEEAQVLLRFPFADEQGLPGLKSRQLPPFYATSVPYCPVKEAPPAGMVRLGLVRSPSGVGGSAGADTELSQWHTVPKDDLCKHAFIVGSTGSGKTITTLFLARELHRLQIPFLVVEPVKTEYYDQLKRTIPELCRYHFENDDPGYERTDSGSGATDEFLSFDPMRLPEGVSVARHVSYLKSCFQAAFPMDDFWARVLESGLRAYYREMCRVPIDRVFGMYPAGLDLFTVGGGHCHRVERSVAGAPVYPSFETFATFFIDYLDRDTVMGLSGGDGGGSSEGAEWVYVWKKIFTQRFNNIREGLLGRAFRKADNDFRRRGESDPEAYNPFSRILQQPAVIELDALPDDEQKSLIMAFLLTFLYERRQADDLEQRGKHRKRNYEGQRDTAPWQSYPTSSPLRHVIIVEEAHRLLSRSAAGSRAGQDVAGLDAKGKGVSLFVDMLAEVRAYGQGIVIVEQIPTKIIPEALKNTNLKVMCRLTSKEDRDFLGEAMDLNEPQKRFVSTLRPVQFILFEEKLDQPLLLELPLPPKRLDAEPDGVTTAQTELFANLFPSK